MDSYQKLIEKTSLQFSNKIKTYGKHLFEYFNFNELYYYKTTNLGYHICVGTNLDFNEYFALNKCYLNNPYLRYPKYFQNGISLLETVSSEVISHIVDVGTRSFNFYHSLELIHKTADGMEAFGFRCNTPGKSALAKIFLEFPLIRLFIKKFKEDNKLLLSRLEDNQIDLAGIIGPEFYKKPVPIMSQKQSAKKSFLKSLGIDSNLFSLTPKERKILELLSKGFSARQMAESIHRSKRTVEHHIERIKDKTCCSSRAELMEKAKELEIFEITYM